MMYEPANTVAAERKRISKKSEIFRGFARVIFFIGAVSLSIKPTLSELPYIFIELSMLYIVFTALFFYMRSVLRYKTWQELVFIVILLAGVIALSQRK